MTSKTIGLAFFWLAVLSLACSSSSSAPTLRSARCSQVDGSFCDCFGGEEGNAVSCQKGPEGVCCATADFPTDTASHCECQNTPVACRLDYEGFCECARTAMKGDAKVVGQCFPGGSDTKQTGSTKGHCCKATSVSVCYCTGTLACSDGEIEVESCSPRDVAGCSDYVPTEVAECSAGSPGGSSSGSSGGETPVINCAKNSTTGACSCREADITLSSDETKVVNCNDAPSGAVVCAHYVTSDAVDACYYRVARCATVDRNYETCECGFRGDGTPTGTCNGSTCCQFTDSCQCTTLTGSSITGTQFDKSCTYQDPSGVKVSSCSPSGIAAQCGGAETKVDDCRGLTWAPPQTGGGSSSSGSTCKSTGESCSSSLECCGLCNMNSKSASYHECE
jgi:hypothetical protein